MAEEKDMRNMKAWIEGTRDKNLVPKRVEPMPLERGTIMRRLFI